MELVLQVQLQARVSVLVEQDGIDVDEAQPAVARAVFLDEGIRRVDDIPAVLFLRARLIET